VTEQERSGDIERLDEADEVGDAIPDVVACLGRIR